MKKMKGKAAYYNLVSTFYGFSSFCVVQKGFLGFPPTANNDNMFTITF